MRAGCWWTFPALILVVGTAHAQVDLGRYLKRDPFGTIKISPTGEYYAATVPLEDRTILVVMRRSDKQVTAKVGGERHSVVSDFEWANPERVVVSMAERFGSEDQPHPTGELYAVNADGSKRQMIFGRFGLDGGEPRQEAAFLIDALRGDDRGVLISAFTVGADPKTRVERLDIYNGRRSASTDAPVRRARFVADASGEVRFAVGAGYDNVSKLYYRARRGDEWRLINDEAQSGVVAWPLGFGTDGNKAYLQREHEQGPDEIVEYDTSSGSMTPKLRDQVVDPYLIVSDPATDAPQGALFMHAGMRSAFFDESSAIARRQRMLEKAFPGHAVTVTSATDDGKLLIVAIWNERNPGDFYLFDTRTHQANLVFSRREWFDPARTAPTRLVELRSRDGLPLYGYLTTPPGEQESPRPLVVVPHGGPYGVYDEWEFNDDAQLLAEAGYSVLRINYRGSGNYGRAFMHAGAREWGGRIQDDVTDATRWAIGQKIADPDRICIFGASYGGYAALMGAVREPGMYRCAVGYVGVYDLELMHKQTSRTSKSRHAWTNDWVGSRGSLASVSPSRLADAVKVPVLLAAGGEDEIAPIAHSKRMEKALREAGATVETVYFDTEGHGFYTEPHRREFYTRLLDFLARHLGGQRAQ